jgi:hypothetical protein
VTGLDAADVEGFAVVGVGLADTDGVGELVAEADAGAVVLPASEPVTPAPPFPPPGLCDVSRTAATATITTAAATGTSQRHRRARDGGLRGGTGGMLPEFGPRSSGPETGTRDVSGRTCSSRVAGIAAAPTAAAAAAAPTAGSRVVGS